MALIIEKYLKEENINCEIFPFEENRANLIASLSYNYNVKSLLFNAHMDVVPPYVVNLAKKVHQVLLDARINSFYDSSGSIGKRYRRQDELGTPFCITIDYDSLSDDTVTLRDRDSMKQVRIKVDEVSKKILSKIF